MFPRREHNTDSEVAHPTLEKSKSQAQETRADGVLSSDETSNEEVTSGLSLPPDGGWQAWLCSMSISPMNH